MTASQKATENIAYICYYQKTQRVSALMITAPVSLVSPLPRASLAVTAQSSLLLDGFQGK